MTQFNDILDDNIYPVKINGKTSYMPHIGTIDFSSDDVINGDEQEIIIDHGKTTLITYVSNGASYNNSFTIHLSLKNFKGKWYGMDENVTPNIILSTNLTLTEISKVVDLQSIHWEHNGNNTIMSVILQPTVVKNDNDYSCTTFMCEIYLSNDVVNIELKRCLSNLLELPQQ